MSNILRALGIDVKHLDDASNREAKAASYSWPQPPVIPGPGLIPAQWIGRAINTPTWSDERAISVGYRAHPNVYRAVQGAAHAVGSVPITVSRRASTDEWQIVDDHPLARLLANPSPGYSQGRLLRHVTQSLLLTGNAIVRKVLGGTKISGASMPVVVALVPTPAPGWKPVLGEGGIVAYEYLTGSSRIRVDASEVLHFQFEDPANPYWGASPLASASKILETIQEAIDWNRASMGNRAVSDLIFRSKVPLTDDEYQRARSIIESQHAGSGNAYQSWVLGSDFDVQMIGRSPVEMDFVRTLEHYRRDLLSALGVPPVVAGYFDDATLANAEVSVRMWWHHQIAPICMLIAEEMRRGLIRHFGRDGELWIDLDLDSIPAMQEDLHRRLQSFALATRSGISYSDARALLDLDISPEQPAEEQGQKGAASLEQKALPVSDIAIGTDDDDLGDLIDRLVARLKRALRMSVLELRSGIDSAELLAAVSAMSASAVMGAIGLPSLQSRIESALSGALRAAWDAGSMRAVEAIAASGARYSPSAALRETVVRGVARSIADLISGSTERGISVAMDAFRRGALGAATAADMAEYFSSTYGLHGVHHERLVGMWERMVSQQLSRDVILHEIARASRSMLAERIAVIADTEAVRAVHQAELSVWRDARSQGAVRKVTKTWVTAADELVCPVCAPLDGQTVDIDSRFDGGFDAPPAPHPHCRCGTLIEIVS